MHPQGRELPPNKYLAGSERVVNLGGRLYSHKIMCRIQWHFCSNLQTSSSVWLFKKYDFMLADHNISVFTTLCCQVVAIWRYQLLSYLTSDHRSETINFYNILSNISYLLSDRRYDANTILKAMPSHLMNICGKFHWDIVWCEITLMDNRQTAGHTTRKHCALAA